MMRSLFAAVSGLRNHQMSLSVIGNNIANINTIGFKAGRALFQEMLTETIQGASRPSEYSAGMNPIQVGLGMSVATVSQSFGQGQLQLTGNMMDMAVQGEGFFVLREGGQNFYGRAGAFGFDGDGRLTAGQGLLVQGWMANDDGQLSSGAAVGDIELPFGQKSPARATTEIRLQSNLDAAAEALSTITQTNPFLARALSTDGIENLSNSTGQDLGVQLGDALTVSFAGTGDSLVTNLSVDNAPMDLLNGDVISVSDGLGSTNITFDDSWTLSNLAAQVQAALATLGNETDVTVSVNADGSLLFSNPSGGNNVDLTVSLSVSGRSVFNTFVASEPVINGTNTARSSATSVNRTIVVGTHFANLNDLAASLEQTLQLGSVGASVVFDNGQFVYDNSGGSQNLVNLTISRPGSSGTFTAAMALNGGNLDVGQTRQSSLLLDSASEADDLVNLYTLQGTHLGLNTGNVFSFDAREAGSPIPQLTLSVVGTGDGSNSDQSVQTLGGLLEELEVALGLTTNGGVTLEEGRIVVRGQSGLSHELTDLAFNQTGNTTLGTSVVFDELQSATDVTHEASIRVFDSLGTAHLLSMVFTKDNDTNNRWDWEVIFEDGEVTAGGTGAVTFRGDGSLASFTTDDGLPLTINPTTGAEGPMAIDFNAGSNGGVDGMTGFARESTTAIVDQDGFTMGTLESISIDGNGVITGVFTNGTSRSLAQMALASFKNPSGLQRDGGSGWTTTPNSGEPVIRRPGIDSQVGLISAGTLEMSNVDIAQEFTNMIVAQRGFQANARTVTTSDEMLVELVNLKR